MYGDGQWEPQRNDGEWPAYGDQDQYGQGQYGANPNQYGQGQGQYGSDQYGAGQYGGGQYGADQYGEGRRPSAYNAEPGADRYRSVPPSDYPAAARAGHGAIPGSTQPGYRTLDADSDPFNPASRTRRAGGVKDPKGRIIPASRKRKVMKWTALSVVGVLVVIIGLGAYVYIHLNGNINTAALLPQGASQAAEVPNQFGQTPLNVLLIGSDTRATATDCHLGGACQPSLPHADVEMVVHLAADRSNMTVMSIPRDSIVPMSACARNDGAENLINSALNFGPACQVEEIHDMTGLTIDDFIEVDMAGVVTLTNALGGVPVCVQNNVYDPDSHLKLPAGTTNVQGITALEWVRTRHAFPNEVYREEAQHVFMSAMVRKLKQNASLTHITTLYSVADAATKALTVSPALGSVTSLLSLAQEMGKVPTDRITLLSVPTVNYTGPVAAWNQQLQFDQPSANNMFAALKADTSYTSGGSPAPPAPPSGGAKQTNAPVTNGSGSGSYPGNPSAVNKAGVSVSVLNGTGVTGRAGAIKTALTGSGFSGSLISANSTSSTDATAVYYPASRADSASAVASALGIPASAMHLSSNYGQVTVMIGKDWTSGTTFGTASSGGAGGSSGSSTTSSTTVVASSPPATSLLTNGSDSKTCMPIQPAYRW
jgi:LCP family protein required for cell wall assembly